jgi:hypothetical protein
MNTETRNSSSPTKTPWHIWVVGILALIWNASGTYTIVMAQAGRLPGMGADEAEYYAAQATWFVVVTDIALFSAVAAAVALLLRHRAAVWLFAISLPAIAITDIYDLAVGASRALLTTPALIVTALIFVIAILELGYAWTMRNRLVLR